MNILLVEDDQFKARRLERTLGEIDPSAIVVRANSVTASVRALDGDEKFALVVLDMSLPTFDVGPRESGGRPEGFGGREVMRFMVNNDVDVPVIIVTQFETFLESGREIDLATLARSLANEFPRLFNGVVYYDAASERWQSELKQRVADARGK